MATSYSYYPEALDGYTSLPLVTDGVSEIRARDVNSLRDAIVKIEQELGVQPSGTYATVRARLDSVVDAASLISAHLLDDTDAHDASAISILDSSENYVSGNVEDALGELAAVLPAVPDTIGYNNTAVPNSGVPNFATFTGDRFVYNQVAISSTLQKTQPYYVTGLQIIDVGSQNSEGTAYLSMTDVGYVKWQAPNDSVGSAVDVSSLDAGDVITLSSYTSSKKIRVARTSDSLPTADLLPLTDTFEVLKLDACSGAYSYPSVGIKTSNFITRTASTRTGTSQNQFVISGVVYPADKGVMCLQRKVRDDDQFEPVAILDLEANFSESLRSTGQLVYTPTMSNYDSILLYDRYPARNDYDDLDLDATGNPIYSNFDLTTTYSAYQIAKYKIPASNSDLVSGELEAPTDFTDAEIGEKVATYRIVHYKEAPASYSGNPSSSDVYSLYDVYGSTDNNDSNVRASNVYVDSNTTRPTVAQVLIEPVVPSSEISTKFLSGINYYNSNEDLFELKIKLDNMFKNSYKYTNALTLESDIFYFTSGDGYGKNINLVQLMDDGYAVFSDTNYPEKDESAYYMATSSINTTRRLYPDDNKFSTNAMVMARAWDPFGSSSRFDGYAFAEGHSVRALVSSWPRDRATDSVEYFVDESRRVGKDETFDFAVEREQYTSDYGANGDGYGLTAFNETVQLTQGWGPWHGELQVGGRFVKNFDICGLIYPQSNYTNVVPSQADCNYSIYTFATELIYQRLFNLGYSASNYRIRVCSSGDYPLSFENIRYGNSNKIGRIMVKVPGTGKSSTGWLDIGRLFNSEYEDDHGCLAGRVTGSAGDFTVPITLGARSTSDNEGMLAVRVLWLGAQATVARQVILTRLELLPWK